MKDPESHRILISVNVENIRDVYSRTTKTDFFPLPDSREERQGGHFPHFRSVWICGRSQTTQQVIWICPH